MRKIKSFLLSYIKQIGILNARKAIETATQISKYRTNNLALYGEHYRKSIEFKKLEFSEKLEILKYELYKAIFRIKL